MGRDDLVKAINHLTEELRLLDYHLANERPQTLIRHHCLIVKRAMKDLGKVIDAGITDKPRSTAVPHATDRKEA